MLRFLFKNLLQINLPGKDLVFSPQNNPSLISISNPSYSTVQSSFTSSYLKKSCKLSLESVLFASEKASLKSTQQPYFVLSFLESVGFSKTHLLKIITKHPKLLSSNPNKTLKPKFDFLTSWAFQALPLQCFSSQTPNFTLAMHVMAGLSKLNWDKKMEVYQSLGWSVDECLSVFRLQPIFMSTYEEKIRRVVNFFVNEYGWKLSMVSKCPNLVKFSVGRRIVPRCSIVHLLISKGIVKKDLNIFSVLKYTESSFVEKFVTKYQEKIPEVLNAYQGEVRLGLEEKGQNYNS